MFREIFAISGKYNIPLPAIHDNGTTFYNPNDKVNVLAAHFATAFETPPSENTNPDTDRAVAATIESTYECPLFSQKQ